MDDLPPSPDAPDSNLSEDARSRIKAELRPGERLIWASGSHRNPTTTDGGCGVPLGVMVVICWTIGLVGLTFGVRPDANGVAAVVGVAGVIFGFLFGLGLLATGWERFKGRRMRGRRLYALTDRRAIAWEPQHGTEGITVVSFGLGEIVRVWRVDYPDGLGDVVFRLRTGGPTSGLSAREQSFLGVPDVRRVEELLRGLSRDARPGRGGRSAPGPPSDPS